MAVKVEWARGDFTAYGGLVMFDKMMLELNLYDRLKNFLPGSSPLRVRRSYQKFHAMILGFIAGADTLDYMDNLHDDTGFTALCRGKSIDSRRYGDFLRRFEVWHPRHINEVLAALALKLRMAMFKDDPDFILDIDSTIHQQYSQKMEELGWAYNNKWGLSSLQAYDQHGFQYWMDVKGGSRHTSDGVPTLIQKVFKKVSRKMNRYMRGDSGMCTFDVFRACLDNDVDFCIAMRANMYEPLIRRVRNWYPTKDIYFKDGRKAEIGTAIYYPQNLDRERPLRVVFIRAAKEQPELIGDFNLRTWDFHAWVTSIPESEMQQEKVVEFYKGRGNAENFIRETKNALDLHHFPCKKIIANKIYGLIAAFAHNLMRMASWTLDKETPRFSKKIRFRMVYLAGQVVKKSRYWIIRLSNSHHKEVSSWLQHITQQLGSG